MNIKWKVHYILNKMNICIVVFFYLSTQNMKCSYCVSIVFEFQMYFIQILFNDNIHLYLGICLTVDSIPVIYIFNLLMFI